MKKRLPIHFWQIHRKVYRREWNSLDKDIRANILNDLEGAVAEYFFKYVMDTTKKLFEDENCPYNSKYKFQYSSI